MLELCVPSTGTANTKAVKQLEMIKKPKSAYVAGAQ